MSRLEQTPNNTAAKDFICLGCQQGFELKSKRGLFGNKVSDGAYESMLASIRSETCPSLLLLSYSPAFQVQQLVAIPSRFLVAEIVVPRKPLGTHCRRAGWQGCNLNIGLLPPEGRITCVTEFKPLPPEQIKIAWDRTAFLNEVDAAARGWLALVMGLIRRLQKDQFTLHDLYALEAEAKSAFPKNIHIKAKLRQQLQRLRDLGWLEFEGHGKYRLVGDTH
jgi:type II restriction enzyme